MRSAIGAARVIDGSGRLFDDGMVLIEDGQIAAVGTRQELASAWTDTSPHDYGDATILPGLVDAHVHVAFTADGRPYDEMMAEGDEYLALIGVENTDRHLASGVTTMRDNGARNRTTFAVKRFLAGRPQPSAQLLVAGRPLTPSGGHLHWCNGVADGPEAIRARVGELAAEGADHIKLVASGGGTKGTRPYEVAYSRDDLAVAVDAAHELNLLTAAHCHARDGIENAVDAGVDCLEHVSFLVERQGAQLHHVGASWSGLTAEYDSRLAERISLAGSYVSATLLGGYAALIDLRAKLERGETLSEDERTRMATASEHVERKVGIVASFIEDGHIQRLVISTDAGPGDTRFGQLHVALALAVEAGLTPTQAVEAATRVAADACGVGDRVGTLEPGKDADVLIVAGDAARDIRALESVLAVYKRGASVALPE